MKQRTKRLFVTLAVFAVSVLAVFAGGCKTVAKWKDKFDQLRCEHEWTDGEVTEEATCETDGVLTKTCTKCDKEKVEVILAWGHSWNDGEVTKEPTCEEDGELTKVCLTCEATKTEELPATGHEWELETVITEATCAEAGEGTYGCTSCEATKTEAIPTTEHNLVEWTEVDPATCEREGREARWCLDCGFYESKAIEPLGGTCAWELDTVTNEPTCSAEGLYGYRCNVCNGVTDRFIPKLPHTDNDGDAVCDVCEETDLTEALISADAGCEILSSGDYYRVYREEEEFEIALGERTMADGTGYAVFYARIPAKGDAVEAVVYEDTFGYEQTVFDIYTYEDYVEIRFNEGGAVYTDGALVKEIEVTEVVEADDIAMNAGRLYRIYELTANVETTE